MKLQTESQKWRAILPLLKAEKNAMNLDLYLNRKKVRRPILLKLVINQLFMIIRSGKQISRLRKIRSVSWSASLWNFSKRWIIFLCPQENKWKKLKFQPKINSTLGLRMMQNQTKILRVFQFKWNRSKGYRLNFHQTIQHLQTNRNRTKIANSISKFNRLF